ncbi:MAG: ATP-binding protein [Bacteroidota bacterium]
MLIRYKFWLSLCCLALAFSASVAVSSLWAQDSWYEDSLTIEQLSYQAWKLKNLQPDSARLVAEDVISRADQNDFPKGRADGLHILGLLEWAEGDMTQALDHYLDALSVRKSINDSLGLGRSHNNIGNVYFQLEQIDSAEVHYYQGMIIREQLKDIAGLIYSYSNLGDIALATKDVSEAESYYMMAYELAEKDSIFSGLAHVSGRQGRLALERGDLTKAQATWEQAVRYAEQANNRRLLAGAIQEAIRLAMINDQIEIPAHIESAKRSMALAAEVSAVDLQAEAAILVAQLAAANRDLSEAYDYQIQYQELTEVLIQEQKNDAVMAILEQKDAELKAEQDRRTAKENSDELSRQNIQLGFWALVILLLVIAGSFAINYRAFRRQSELVERLEANNKELDARYDDLQEFAKIASHDLKEPVRNIGAFANLIERRYAVKLDDKGIEYLEFIIKSAHQMNALLNDLLTFSNIPRYEQEALQPTFLHQLVGEVVAQKKKEHGAFQFVGTTLPTIHAYPNLIEILLVQLIDNALKFNIAELKQVEIGYDTTEADHILWIADNGLGIDPNYHEQIFDIFSRLGKRDQAGTGMGLAISKRIIETHRGRIWVESKPKEGTRFYFTIPRHSMDNLADQDYLGARSVTTPVAH